MTAYIRELFPFKSSAEESAPAFIKIRIICSAFLLSSNSGFKSQKTFDKDKKKLVSGRILHFGCKHQWGHIVFGSDVRVCRVE